MYRESHLQKDALEKIGCTKIYSDVVSGAKAERKGLEEALEYVREGDTQGDRILIPCNGVDWQFEGDRIIGP
jgi:DNA invertase Pin-like site-specific DNA recombinase